VEINGKQLTPEQIALYKRMSSLQQGVALGVLGGLSQREAYLQAGGKSTGANADVSANQTLKTIKVREFIDSFRAGELDRLADVVMSRDEMALTLTGISRNVQEGPQSRLGAMKQLSVLMGYDKPLKVENSGTTTTSHRLADFYSELTVAEVKAVIADLPADQCPADAIFDAAFTKAGF